MGGIRDYFGGSLKRESAELTSAHIAAFVRVPKRGNPVLLIDGI